jgi:hypothetical protein
VIETLVANGVTSFDVASISEIELVTARAPGARMAFMHPVKSRAAIAAAYFDHGIRTFALDTHEELAKILEATNNADDLALMVRLAVSAHGAAYSLAGKFGAEPHEAPALLLAARRATQDRQPRHRAGRRHGRRGRRGRRLPVRLPGHDSAGHGRLCGLDPARLRRDDGPRGH